MRIDTLTVVGVGLIGGSAPLPAGARGVARRVGGVGRSPESLSRAVAAGALDAGTCDLAAAAGESEFVLICTPVDRIAGQVREAGGACRPGAVLTDAGSTKDAIV